MRARTTGRAAAALVLLSAMAPALADDPPGEGPSNAGPGAGVSPIAAIFEKTLRSGLANEEAKRLTNAAARAGDPLARFWRARCLHEGAWSFEADPAAAEREVAAVYDQVRAMAEAGDADACYLIGVSVLIGFHGPADAKVGLRWLERAGTKGHAMAQGALGDCFSGGVPGVDPDPPRAVSWYQRAGERGFLNAQFNLALLYFEGAKGVERDLEEAFRWFLRAAEAGLPIAQREVGVCYVLGEGVAKDREEAKRWLRRAADAGDARAAAGLSRLAAEEREGGRPAEPTPPRTPAGDALTAFEAPGWRRERPSLSIRREQFALPRVEGDPEDGLVVVIVLPGEAGGVDANIDRWLLQFRATREQAKVYRLEGAPEGVQVTVVETTGPYGSGAETKPDWALLGAIVRVNAETRFVTGRGPARTMAAQRAAFLDYVRAVAAAR